MVKTVGKYDLYGTLGEGAFGKVKYAVNTETNEAVAIKILDKDKIQTRNMGAQIKKEISIMKMINHHHVVSVKDVFATSAKIFIVLEFVGGGELFDKIANEGKLPEEKARFYFKQLVEGLEHCHNSGVCHRDLKPENLLLDTDGNLKISDFGFSTLNIGDADGDGNTRAELLHTTCGTPNYVAPEVLGKDGYDGFKADVWSIGVILYVLLAGYLPFDENTMAALFQKIRNADFEYPDWFSPLARDLLSKVLVPDPHTRAKLSELKNHPWMHQGEEKPAVTASTSSAAAVAQAAQAQHSAAHPNAQPPVQPAARPQPANPPAPPAPVAEPHHHHQAQQQQHHAPPPPQQQQQQQQHHHQPPPPQAQPVAQPHPPAPVAAAVPASTTSNVSRNGYAEADKHDTTHTAQAVRAESVPEAHHTTSATTTARTPAPVAQDEVGGGGFFCCGGGARKKSST